MILQHVPHTCVCMYIDMGTHMYYSKDICMYVEKYILAYSCVLYMTCTVMWCTHIMYYVCMYVLHTDILYYCIVYVHTCPIQLIHVNKCNNVIVYNNKLQFGALLQTLIKICHNIINVFNANRHANHVRF